MKNKRTWIQAAAAILMACAAIDSHADTLVQIDETEMGYNLAYNGKPFTIRGATMKLVAGNYKVDDFVQAGGNTVRLWDLADLDAMLLHASDYEFAVAVDLWQLLEPGDGDLRAEIGDYLTKARNHVRGYKVHDAVLLWIVGEESAWPYGDEADFLKTANAMAKMVKEEDPDRPTVVIIDDPGEDLSRIAQVRTECPDIDILGVNTFGTADTLAERLKQAGWTKPYVLGAFGARAPRESTVTLWESPIEDCSTAKAAAYARHYLRAVDFHGGWCLGSFAYIWGHKDDATHTWYSMYLPDGSRLGAVDAVQHVWSGQWPIDRCPEMCGIESAAAEETVDPDVVYEAYVQAYDPEGTDLTFTWEVRTDTTTETILYEEGEPSEVLEGLIETNMGDRVRFRTPADPGSYRLFAYAYDPLKQAASANIPFRIGGGDGAAPVGDLEETADESSRVYVKQTKDGYQLYYNDEPYFIEGAGLREKREASLMPSVVEAGGNSIRTWGADYIDGILDKAYEQGLTVTITIWLQHERHGFDYSRPDVVAAQLSKAEYYVNKYKDHPALLMWVLGNETEWFPGTNAAVYKAINDVVKQTKQLDPNHPTMTILAELGDDDVKVDFVKEYVPDVDILGINTFGGCPTVADRLKKKGWTKPYIVTEFGPKGPWEVETTSWTSPVEQITSEKGAFYLHSYTNAVVNQPGWCLGSYCFLWGQKQEMTPTWFSMHLRDDTVLSPVQYMQYAWTGSFPSNLCPVIHSITSEVAYTLARPSMRYEASVEVEDPEGDELTYHWELMSETEKPKKFVEFTSRRPEEHPDAILTNLGKRVEFRSPWQPGEFRLFCYVTDGKGNGASANFPFKVQRIAKSVSSDPGEAVAGEEDQEEKE